ncbi:hypothetical protein [Pseudomonas cavernicola]|nr:hypothetical protein [Pseudomonas cavernicola]
MRSKQQNPKSALIAKFSVEAIRRGGSVSSNQRRFFKVAAELGKELEPVDVLSGARA